MRRMVVSLLTGLMAVVMATSVVGAAAPSEWVHVCVFPEPDGSGPNTNYGFVSGPGMNTAGARYWTAWCDEMNGQVRGVRPFSAAVK